ncbi:hypothetical protein H5410_045767 [Solanum commersonii]|uniref:Uncharacterized protein n=1 Tax=Solanum commersonii TaxID=4109 RepID=A0A9J5XCJ3_SOLCO|nr:hypothetical protein H5410_045767 [Solanum commersonii]
MVFRKCALKDFSATLVRIADAFGDPLFGLLHRLSSISFNVFVSWIIGQCSTASRSRSVIHQHLLFTVDFSFPSWLSILEQKENMRSVGDSLNGFGD